MSGSSTPPWIPETEEEKHFFRLHPSVPVEFRAANPLNPGNEFDARHTQSPADAGHGQPGCAVILQFPTGEQYQWRCLGTYATFGKEERARD